MKKINLLLVLAIAILFGCSMQPKSVVVCEKDKTEQLKITADQLLLFFKENNKSLVTGKQLSQFAYMKVISNATHPYIIARDTVNAKTFAVELQTIDNKLCFDKYSLINICECEQTDETSFSIQADGSISGCNGGNHTTSKTEK